MAGGLPTSPVSSPGAPGVCWTLDGTQNGAPGGTGDSCGDFLFWGLIPDASSSGPARVPVTWAPGTEVILCSSPDSAWQWGCCTRVQGAGAGHAGGVAFWHQGSGGVAPTRPPPGRATPKETVSPVPIRHWCLISSLGCRHPESRREGDGGQWVMSLGVLPGSPTFNTKFAARKMWLFFWVGPRDPSAGLRPP